ncbi:MAG: GNAT family N-acetyltransferase [Candidatus Odinarchaeota archaeon]
MQDYEGDLWCPKSIITPINGESRRTSIICSGNYENILNTLLRYLLEKKGKFRLALKNVKKESKVVKLLPQIAKSYKLSTVIFKKASSPILHINTDWRTYFNSLSTHFRRNLRNRRKKRSRIGEETYVTITEIKRCDQAMKDVLAIERNSWKEKVGTSFTAGFGLAQFYKEFAQKCAEKKWLRIHLMYLNSKPMAHTYGLIYKNDYYILKTSFDNRYRSLAPGIAIFIYSIEDAFKQGFAKIDLLGGQTELKEIFSDDSISQVDICVFSKNSSRCMRCTFYQNIVKPFIKNKMPFVTDLIKKKKDSA